MPIYEYECLTNGHRFEKLQSLNDEPIKICEVCGAPVRKVYHPAGIIFKGSGWYKTDSRPKSSSTDGSSTTKSEPAAGTAPKSESNTTTPSTDKTDSKPST